MIRPSRELAELLGCEFNNAALLEEALTHRSASSINGERLEFLGDAILGFVIADRIFTSKPDAPEGDMSRIRASLVRKDTLAKIAKEWNIGDYLQLGSGELKSGGYRRSSILADAVEAIIGALFKDQGLPATIQLIKKLYGERIVNIADIIVVKDPKTQLQEFLQSRTMAPPEYNIKSSEGPDHKRKFVVLCKIEALNIETQGLGKNRRIAEQAAAEAALALIDDGN